MVGLEPVPQLKIGLMQMGAHGLPCPPLTERM